MPYEVKTVELEVGGGGGGEETCSRLAIHPGEVAVLLVASSCGDRISALVS